MLRVPVLAFLALLTVAGCASSSRLRHETPKEAYDRGTAEFNRKRYDRAAEYYQAVFDYGRANEWADDAQIGLARAYMASKQYILAASEYSRFSELYRADPRAAEAEYERALAYKTLSPGYELDQTDTERAISYFQLFINRYPQDARRAAAQQQITDLRGKMARKLYESAGLYERRELYEAAAMMYDRTFAEYPDADYADDALVGATRAYLAYADASVRDRRAERLQKALDAYNRFAQIFPQSPRKAEAEDLYTTIRARLGTGTTAGR